MVALGTRPECILGCNLGENNCFLQRGLSFKAGVPSIKVSLLFSIHIFGLGRPLTVWTLPKCTRAFVLGLRLGCQAARIINDPI